MDAPDALPNETPHTNNSNSTEVVMTDVPTPVRPDSAQPPPISSSMPPPSPLEPSATERRAQSQPTGPAMKGPRLPAMWSPVPGQNGGTPNSGSPEIQRQGDLQNANQYAELSNLIKQSDQAIVRQVLRDQWQKCLVGSEYHAAFVLNTALHQSSPATLNRAVLDFGGKIVANCKETIMKHFTPEGYDEVADTIFPNLSTRFLDRALALRVETIEAKALVNILARAERLGYSIDDIVEEHPATNGIGKTEQVIPAMTGVPLDLSQPPHQQPQPQYTPSQPQHQPQHQQQHQQGALDATQINLGLVQCGACKRPCTGLEALEYHSKKAACDPDFNLKHVGRSICPHCGCSFGSNGGCWYHLKSEVCGTFSQQATSAVHMALQDYVKNRPTWTQIGIATGSTMGVKKAALPAPTLPPSAQHKFKNSPKSSAPPSSSPLPGGSNPYEHLNTETFERFKAEMAEAEANYGQKMRDAMLLPEPESTDKISRHKNAYNAKISTTRKRYGIRLRERRAKEEVDAERIRLLQRDDAPELWLEQERKARELEKSGKRPFDSGPGTPQSATAVQPPRPPLSQLPLESPRKRVPLSEMGGLSGSAGSAEVIDPTSFQTSSPQSRGFSNVQRGHVPPATQTSRPTPATQGTPGHPVAVDSASTSHSNTPAPGQEDQGSESETNSSEDDGDEDIPAA